MKTMTLFLSVFAVTSAAFASSDPVRFDLDILPILAEKCFQCHGPDANARKADLRLDVEKEAKKSVIVPGDADASEIIRRITSTDDDERMPPPDSQRTPLTPDEAALFREWIASGAEWAGHWAFATPARPELPNVEAEHWPRNEIDRFVLARLEREGLQPSNEASRATLIRRLSFDLTGLPPMIEEVDAFVLDNSEEAYEKAVDRLLASPRYGENMARIWLDLARYADTNGYQNDFGRMMWPWRDWVIQAYNENMPFDQFTLEQIAGDLLPDPEQSQLVATGFNRNNRANTEGGSIEDEWRVENIVDRVETTSTVFLGLSMGCARCHDHKFDPISQREFYQFFSFFNHTEDKGFYAETRGNTGPTVSLPSEENERRIAEYDKALEAANAEIPAVAAKRDDAFDAWLSEVRAALNETHPVKPSVDLSFAANLPGYALGDSPADVIELGQSVTFAAAAPFSVALWVRPDKPGALFSKMDDAQAMRGVDTLVTAKGELMVHLVHAWDTNAIKVVTDPRMSFGVWSHVCVTYDGAGKAAGVRVFVNGEAAETKAEKDSLDGELATTQPLRIGSRSASEQLAGAVVAFQVFDAALEPEIIDAAFRASAGALFLDGEAVAHETELDALFDLKYGYLVGAKRTFAENIEKERNEYVNNNVPTVMVMRELDEPRPTHLLVRGAYDAPDTSEDLPPAVPSFLPPLPEGAPHNRMGLARWLVDPANPLTARVAVNRLWQQLFGQGLVKTVEDFGVQGAPPTHPALLDWLATEFVASGWDIKGMQKTIVMSATYRQTSDASPALHERDPENLLLARGARYRIPAEAVRDTLLAASGLLSPKLGGPPVKPYQPEGLWEELAGGAGDGPYVQSEGEDLYRRSLYIFRKRTVPPPMLTTFDSPGWDLCRARRARTNTPLQALALLNDVAYVEAARKLAERMLTEAPPEARAAYGFRLVTGRAPSVAEQQTLERGLGAYMTTYAADGEAALSLVSAGESARDELIDPGTLAAYTALASVMMNLDEAITKE